MKMQEQKDERAMVDVGLVVTTLRVEVKAFIAVIPSPDEHNGVSLLLSCCSGRRQQDVQ